MSKSEKSLAVSRSKERPQIVNHFYVLSLFGGSQSSGTNEGGFLSGLLKFIFYASILAIGVYLGVYLAPDQRIYEKCFLDPLDGEAPEHCITIVKEYVWRKVEGE